MQFMSNVDEMRAQQEAEDERSKLDELIQLKEENLAIARQKRLQMKMEMRSEQNTNSWEVNNMLTDRGLAESASQANSMFAPHRVRADHWKGMVKEQGDSIFQQNGIIVKEKQAKKEAEKMDETEWVEYQNEIKGLLAQKDVEEATAAQEKTYELHDYHQQQMQENKMRETINKKISVGEVRDDFHTGFGSSFR